MRAHYFQHFPCEGLGSIEPWLEARGYEITNTQFHQADSRLPSLDGIDLVIALGGPMSVNDEKEWPWLVEEKKFIRRAIESGRSVLGICLGSQLIASALGARVVPHHVKEIGWFPIQGLPNSDPVLFRFPATTTAFHWHGETWDLPRDAVLLARSEACQNQAFQLGRSVLGLQFHLETTLELAREMVTDCGAELQPAPYVQSESAILAAPPERYRQLNELMDRVLSFVTKNESGVRTEMVKQ